MAPGFQRRHAHHADYDLLWLFNVAEDPLELHDLSTTYPLKVGWSWSCSAHT